MIYSAPYTQISDIEIMILGAFTARISAFARTTGSAPGQLTTARRRNAKKRFIRDTTRIATRSTLLSTQGSNHNGAYRLSQSKTITEDVVCYFMKTRLQTETDIA